MEQQLASDLAREKKGGSFVWKITLRQTVRSLGSFFWIDMLIIVLFWGGVLYGAERLAPTLLPGEAVAGAGRHNSSVSASGVFFTVNTWPGEPINDMPGFFTRRLGFLPGVRGFHIDNVDTGGGMANRAKNISYVITTPIADGLVCGITFTPGIICTGFVSGFAVLLFFQAISLISGIFKISRSVYRTLLPINQLTMATRQSMSAQNAPRKPADLQLGSTIDTLNAITESRLDARIDVAGEREELRGLAGAINSMLDRVDSAYRSQLRFISDASHELRTPISVIQGYASLLNRWGKEDQKTLDEAVAAILSESAGMKKLVEQLLFLARSDNNSITLRMESVDLAALTREVAKESGMIDTRHKIGCPQRSPLFTSGDCQLLKQALRILMDNAIKYTPEDGSITLDVKETDGYAVVSVTDNGIGIGAYDLPKLFDRFYRADASRARRTGGTGLGLSIAKWIVDSHGGAVEILSREGLGTRIVIKLPVHDITAENRTADCE